MSDQRFADGLRYRIEIPSVEGPVVKLARERLRRAELVVRLLADRAPDLVEGRGGDGPAGLAIPVHRP